MLKPGEVLSLLEPGGALSLAIKGFESRQEQKEMLQDVVSAFNEGEIALIEAGTGTGKSMAYLIPALLFATKCQGKVLISTRTINLQEQLFHKDLPELQKALNLDVKVVIAKGMYNYLCKRKLKDSEMELAALPEEEKDQFEKIVAWQAGALSGSKTDLPFTPSEKTWERVCCESDSCNGKRCPFYKECFFFKARKEAENAKIIIANHNLFFADIANDGTLLPPYEKIILDEAHHIEDIATEYFASKASRFDLLKTITRLASERMGKLTSLRKRLQECAAHDPEFSQVDLAELMHLLTLTIPLEKRKLLDAHKSAFDAFERFVGTVNQEMEAKLRLLPQVAKVLSWTEEIIPAATLLIQALQEFHSTIHLLNQQVERLPSKNAIEKTEGIRLEIRAASTKLDKAASHLAKILDEKPEAGRVKWMEKQKMVTANNITLTDAELDISHHLAELLFSKYSTIILTSATMTTHKKFRFLRERLGLTPEKCSRTVIEKIYPSPFHYQKQALLAVPSDMPAPDHPNFEQEAVEKIWMALRTSRGGAFILFTSYSMLLRCYAALLPRIEKERFTLFKQGDADRAEIVESFRKTKNGILFATDSFWEGVDVVGQALRCVIIVKLPFRVPTDPLLEARAEALQAEGKNPFQHYAIPLATLKFKQGFGRLIRHKSDRGCFLCLDSRLITRNYGKHFLSSLPSNNILIDTGENISIKMKEFYKNHKFF